MSMSLILWKSPVVTKPEQAAALLDEVLSTGSQSAFDPSADVVRFYDELTARFPPHEALSEEDLRAGASGWAESPERSDRVLLLDIRWSADDELLDAIAELARKHELVLYDPQGPDVHWGSADDEDQARPSLGEFVQAAVAGTLGLLLAVGAWLVSIPVVTWLLVVVGGFLAVAAVYTLVVLTQQAWRLRG
jgi:hypothetical protein